MKLHPSIADTALADHARGGFPMKGPAYAADVRRFTERFGRWKRHGVTQTRICHGLGLGERQIYEWSRIRNSVVPVRTVVETCQLLTAIGERIDKMAVKPCPLAEKLFAVGREYRDRHNLPTIKAALFCLNGGHDPDIVGLHLRNPQTPLARELAS